MAQQTTPTNPSIIDNVPWWVWAGLAAIASYKASHAKRPMCQAVAGIVTIYSGYKAYDKINQK